MPKDRPTLAERPKRGPILLVGDSVIANQQYVEAGQDTGSQLQTLMPEAVIHNEAIDGWYAESHAELAQRLIPYSCQGDPDGLVETVVLSAGGNDALWAVHAETAGDLMKDLPLSVWAPYVQQFQLNLAITLKNLAQLTRFPPPGERPSYHRNVTLVRNPMIQVLTVYAGWWDDPEVQAAANIGASIFNDVIYRTCQGLRFVEVFDIRTFMHGRDMFEAWSELYIEPSAKGSRFIAEGIAERHRASYRRHRTLPQKSFLRYKDRLSGLIAQAA
jgi:lysophospholipase L1-like esterase